MRKLLRQPWWKYLLALLVLADLALSAYQYFQLPLDGDLASIVLPNDHYAATLDDPLAIGIWAQGQSYAGAGRSFAHWWLKGYFDSVPLALQAFFDPVFSLYAAAALFRWGAHLAFLLLLLIIAKPPAETGAGRKNQTASYWMGAVMAFPLLQIGGFYPQFGLVDQSVSYAAFYAWPFVGLLWWWRPFLRSALHGLPLQLSGWSFGSRCLMALPLALSGPLVGPCHLILMAIVTTEYLLGRKLKWQSFFWPMLTFVIVSVYAYAVGRMNTETPAEVPSLLHRYQELLGGLRYQLTIRLGMPLLLLGLTINYWLASVRLPRPQWMKIKRFYRLLLIFSILYLCLLPIGGWRSYRSSIIRADTQLPITIGLLLLLLMTSWRLLISTSAGPAREGLLHFGEKAKRNYRAGLLAFLLLFQLADVNLSSSNACEYATLQQLCESEAEVTVLGSECAILNWDRVRETDNSRQAAEFLVRTGVTDSLRLFRQE